MNTILKWIIGIVVAVILLVFLWFVFPVPWILSTTNAPVPTTVPTVDVHTQRFNTSVDACIKAGLSFEGNVVSGDVKCVPVPVVEQAESPETPQLVAPTATQSAEVQSPVVPEVKALPEVTSANDWTITWLPGASLDRGDGTTFKTDAEKWTWLKIAPELWPTFPNEPNPLVPEFKVVTCADDPSKLCVPDGLENAMQETNFCQQLAGEECKVPVAAMHYLLYTGDYNIPGIGECHEEKGVGCELAIVNVGGVTADFTGEYDQGFRIHARYWNGNKLDQAIWALTSHTANVMLNMNSKLNPADIQNAGANCSIPTGCVGVDVTFAITSGNQVLVIGHTVINK